VLGARLSWAAVHPCYEHGCSDPTLRPGLLFKGIWQAGREYDHKTVVGQVLGRACR